MCQVYGMLDIRYAMFIKGIPGLTGVLGGLCVPALVKYVLPDKM